MADYIKEILDIGLECIYFIFNISQKCVLGLTFLFFKSKRVKTKRTICEEAQPAWYN